LSHLSQENNSPELLLSLFEAHKTDTRVIIASRYQETQVYPVSFLSSPESLNSSKESIPEPHLKKKGKVKAELRQLSLF
jgi:hypothetical protein